MQNTRLTALRILAEVLQGRSLSEQLELQLPRLVESRDRSFCSEICFGVTRFYLLLHKQLQTYLKKPFKTRDRDIELLLIMGLYQLRFMQVESYAAVNETVALSRQLGKPWARGVINAVLRQYQRDQQQSPSSMALSEKEHAESYPDWMLQRLRHDWGQQADAILRAGNVKAPMMLRIDTQRSSRKLYIMELKAAGIQAELHPLVESAIVLRRALAVTALPGFSEGLVSIQNASAQLAAPLLQLDDGMRVLDACAAPGGKTTHILQSARALKVTALDHDGQRLQRVAQNLSRCQLQAALVAADATEVDNWFAGEAYDRILLDVPCSASGIISHHPDIRLLRRAEDIDSLVRQQRVLLDRLWPLLKSGGLLLYSTCSVFKAENELQMEQFLQRHQNSVESQIKSVQWGQQRSVGRQILAGVEPMDGFYYACLQKTG